MKTNLRQPDNYGDTVDLIPTRMIARISNILGLFKDGSQNIETIIHNLGLSKPTTYRLIKSLELTGFIIRDPFSKQFQLGPLIAKLASNYQNVHSTLSLCAQQELLNLQALSGETVCILIQFGMQGLYLEEYVSNKQLKFIAGKGSTTPLYAGAGGKIILSELSPKNLRMLLNSIRLVPIGPKTIVDKEKLIKDVDKIRRDGHAIGVEEKIAGCFGIAVPIKNYFCPAALDVIGPTSQLVPKITSLLEEMKSSAARISEQLLIVQRKIDKINI